MNQLEQYATVWLGGHPSEKSTVVIEWITSFVLVGLLLLMACNKEGPTAVDTQPPTVEITFPPSNTNVSGVIDIKVAAEDNEQVVAVVFYIDGDSLFVDDAPPWEYTWRTLEYTNERHSIKAKAYDRAGNWGVSEGVNVVVENQVNEPPIATIFLPQDSTSFVLGEEVTLQGDGRDASGNPLQEDQLSWFSRREGNVPTWLGTGTYLTIDTLSSGWHTITLLATDDNQLTGRDSTSIHISAEAQLLQITRDSNNDRNPCWSPDGQRLAFSSNRTGNSEIWVIPKGGEPTQLTMDPSYDWEPAWHGSEIAFTSMRSGNADIWKIPEGGGTAVQVTADPGWDEGVSWSPDGLYFIVSSQMGPGIWHYLWILPMGVGDTTQLTTETGYEPDWFLGGDVAFRGGDGNIYITSPASMVPQQITWDPDFDGSPSWSPNGDGIAFCSDRSGNMDIWVWSRYEAQPRQLTFHSASDCDPAWSPDGQEIAFSSNREGNYDIWIIPAP